MITTNFRGRACRLALTGAISAGIFCAADRSAGRTVTVNTDGSGDFNTIQAAMDSVPSSNASPCVIQIVPGRYAGRISVPRGKSFVTLCGMGKFREDVMISDGEGKWGVLSISADDFRAENLTVENTAGPAAGPQMALYCDGKRQVFESLLIKGWQDTLGSWNGNIACFHNCEIWGSVDFIYSGGTAVFERCDIVERRDVGGPIAAPSTPKELAYGLVFLNCTLRKAPEVAAGSSTLMRPWRPDGHTAFVNCAMGDHISAKGWDEWDGRQNTCRAVEYGSKTLDGTPIDLSKRASWVKVLTMEQASSYTVTNVLGGWNPAAQKHDAVVAADGSGNYSTVQAAIAAAPDKSTGLFRIFIKPGTYMGPFMIGRDKHHVQLIGEATEKTILTWPYNVNDRKPNQHYQFDPGLVVVGDDFRAENLTIENTSGDHGQALAVRADNDRSVFKDCRILGWQDTLMANNGRHYFTNCFIAGRVDFIYGSGTAVFDHCEILSKNGGYITAANTPEDQPFGFVFLNCKLTGDPAPWVPPAGQTQLEKSDVMTYLGRPWRPHASVAFINCEMGSHIKPEGWDNWGKESNEKTARYSEYGSTGPGANPAARVKWAKLLTKEEAAAFTIQNVFGGVDGWDPGRGQ
jgi:pectinesterase